MVDLDDTSRCPHGDACETCGSTNEFGVTTLDTSIGVYCVHLCVACIDTGKLPRLTIHATALRVLDHCQHLGIDLDQAADLRAAEKETDRG